MFDTLIKNGLVVLRDEVKRLDLGLHDGRIAAAQGDHVATADFAFDCVAKAFEVALHGEVERGFQDGLRSRRQGDSPAEFSPDRCELSRIAGEVLEQAEPEVFRAIDHLAIGKDRAVGNGHHELRAHDASDVHGVGHIADVRQDLSGEL